VRVSSLRRFLGVAALVCAAVVVTHVVTCRVVHRAAMSEAPAGSHAPSMGEHFPNAVVQTATAALLASLWALFALWLVRRPVIGDVTCGPPWTAWAGRSPPQRAEPQPTSPITLRVFRC
jgi:hypothetical protein